MRLTNAATLDEQYRATQMMMSLIQQRVFSLFDLQFILVTGINRLNEELTFEDLTSCLPRYRRDYNALLEFWGDEHPILLPVGLALAQVELFHVEIANNKLRAERPVSDFSNNPEYRSFLLFLAMQITKSISLEGDS